MSADRKFLTVSVVNATDSVEPLTLNVNGVQLAGKSTLWQMTAKDLNAANRVGEKPQVEIQEVAMDSVPQTLSVAPYSVNIYQFPVAQPAH